MRDEEASDKEMVSYEGPQIEKGFIRVSEKPGVREINEEGMRNYATQGLPFVE